MTDRSLATLPTLRDVLARAHLRMIVFSVLMAGTVLLFSGFMIIRGYAEQNLTLVARTAAYTVEPAVVFGDVDAIREGLAQIADMNEVRAIEIVAKDGSLIESWEHPGDSGQNAFTNFLNGIVWPEAEIEEIHRGNEVIAEVRVHGGLGGFVPRESGSPPRRWE